MPTKLRIVESVEACREYREGWNALVRDDLELATGQDATATFEWFENIVETLLPDAMIRVLVLLDEGSVVAVLPIVLGAPSIPGRRIFLPTEAYAGRCGLLYRDPEYLAPLLEGLGLACADWCELQLTLADGSPWLSTLEDFAVTARAGLVAGSSETSPYFSLAATREVFWNAASKSTRQLIRTASNKLSRLGVVSYREMSGPHESEELLETVLSVETRSWKHLAGTAITRQPRQEAFYRQLFHRVSAAGFLLGAVLSVDGLPVAYNFGLLRHRVFSCLKHSHAQAFDNCSPSYLLNKHLIDGLIERGASCFDFMGKVEPHKMRWAPSTSTYTRRTWTVFRPSPRGACAHWIDRAKRLARDQLTRHHLGARGEAVSQWADTPERS